MHGPTPPADSSRAGTFSGPTQLSVWLATPAGRAHFDAARLNAADAARHRSLRRAGRREGFAVSRGLLQSLGLPDDLPYSLSHSGAYGALATGTNRVRTGVDIERHRPRDWLALAHFAFSAEEAGALEAASEESRPRAFYTRWVMKEALAKALQIPLLEATRECRFLEQDGRWTGQAPCDEPWRIIACEPVPDLSLAVAFVGAGCDAQVVTWEWPPLRRVQWPITANFFWPAKPASASCLPAESSTCRHVLPTS